MRAEMIKLAVAFRNCFANAPKNKNTPIQIRSKYSQVKTQLVLWTFILFKVTR